MKVIAEKSEHSSERSENSSEKADEAITPVQEIKLI